MPMAIGGRTSTKFTYVNVPMKAKRMQNPIAKAEQSAGLLRQSTIAASIALRGAAGAAIGGVRSSVR